MEIAKVCWDFVWSSVMGVWGLLEQAGILVWDLLVTLHVQHPRLEGLIIGVSLAWLLSRKDKHPLLRAASAPLGLILDILDLAWDRSIEFLGDVWGTLVGWVKGGYEWCKNKVVGAWSWAIGGLKSIREKLKKEKS